MAEKPTVEKLLVKPGNTVAVIDAPTDFKLTDLPQNARLVAKDTPADVALVFIRSKADVSDFVKTGKSPVVAGGKFWMAYPKKTGAIKTDVHRDVLHPLMGEAGWEGVSLVSLDDTWSAMRFKISAGKK